MTESNDIQVKEQLNIRLVLDRSGSMSSCKEETVVSINEYINEIQKEAVEGVFSLTIVNPSRNEYFKSLLSFESE